MSSRICFASVFAAGALLASLAFASGCSNEQPVRTGQPKGSGSATSSNGHDGHDGHEEKQHSDHAGHGGRAEDAVLMVSTRPRPPKAGEPATLNLMVHAANGAMLKDFDVVHEKQVHLIVVREGLDEFAHIHPEVDGQGDMSIEHTFPLGGTYRLFADYKPTGGEQAIATTTVEVEGPAPDAPPLVVSAPGIVQAEGLIARIDVEIAQEGSSEVAFGLQDEKGEPPDRLEPYLGAMGHLVVISADGQQYVHAHPLHSDGMGSTVRFEVHFPGKGKFKGWGQFQIDGKVHTVPFVVEIE